MEKSERLNTVLEKLDSTVKQKNLKRSKLRECMIKILYKNEGHLSADDLFAETQKKCEKTSLASVYRNLSFLEENSFVKSIMTGNKTKVYELSTKTHHDHFICTNCGKVIEFFDEELEEIQERITRDIGATLTDHSLKLFGVCSDCRI